MALSASLSGSRVKLCLSEDPRTPGRAAFWVGPLVALGGMASRHLRERSGRQLVVAVSVPRRDFAAALVACGWVLDSDPPKVDAPLEALRGCGPETPVRLVTEHSVLVDHFVPLPQRA